MTVLERVAAALTDWAKREAFGEVVIRVKDGHVFAVDVKETYGVKADQVCCGRAYRPLDTSGRT